MSDELLRFDDPRRHPDEPYRVDGDLDLPEPDPSVLIPMTMTATGTVRCGQMCACGAQCQTVLSEQPVELTALVTQEQADAIQAEANKVKGE